jgi:hypothetical protein
MTILVMVDSKKAKPERKGIASKLYIQSSIRNLGHRNETAEYEQGVYSRGVTRKSRTLYNPNESSQSSNRREKHVQDEKRTTKVAKKVDPMKLVLDEILRTEKELNAEGEDHLLRENVRNLRSLEKPSSTWTVKIEQSMRYVILCYVLWNEAFKNHFQVWRTCILHLYRINTSSPKSLILSLVVGNMHFFLSLKICEDNSVFGQIKMQSYQSIVRLYWKKYSHFTGNSGLSYDHSIVFMQIKSTYQFGTNVLELWAMFIDIDSPLTKCSTTLQTQVTAQILISTQLKPAFLSPASFVPMMVIHRRNSIFAPLRTA